MITPETPISRRAMLGLGLAIVGVAALPEVSSASETRFDLTNLAQPGAASPDGRRQANGQAPVPPALAQLVSDKTFGATVLATGLHINAEGVVDNLVVATEQSPALSESVLAAGIYSKFNKRVAERDPLNATNGIAISADRQTVGVFGTIVTGPLAHAQVSLYRNNQHQQVEMGSAYAVLDSHQPAGSDHTVLSISSPEKKLLGVLDLARGRFRAVDQTNHYRTVEAVHQHPDNGLLTIVGLNSNDDQNFSDVTGINVMKVDPMTGQVVNPPATLHPEWKGFSAVNPAFDSQGNITQIYGTDIGKGRVMVANEALGTVRQINASEIVSAGMRNYFGRQYSFNSISEQSGPAPEGGTWVSGFSLVEAAEVPNSRQAAASFKESRRLAILNRRYGATANLRELAVTQILVTFVGLLDRTDQLKALRMFVNPDNPPFIDRLTTAKMPGLDVLLYAPRGVGKRGLMTNPGSGYFGLDYGLNADINGPNPKMYLALVETSK